MIKILFLEAKTKKIEFGRAYVNCISITEAHNPEILLISPAFESAKQAIALAAELKVDTTKLPQTEMQNELMRQLQSLITPLMGHLRALIKMPVSENTATVKLVYEYVNLHLVGFRKENSYKQVGVLTSLFQGIENDPKLKQAIESLNLTTTFAKILSNKLQLEAVYEDQRKALSTRQKARASKAKRQLYFQIRQLFTAIEMAQMGHPEIDYSLLINELNREIERCNASAKTRTSTTAEDVILPDDRVI